MEMESGSRAQKLDEDISFSFPAVGFVKDIQ